MPQARQTAKTTTPPAPAPEGLRLRFDRGERRAAVSVDATRGLATWDEATRTFEFVLATETPCRTYRWDERTWMCFEVDEVLPMAALSDVEGIRGAPILNTHWSYSLDNVLGVIEEARVEGTSLICRGRLSAREDISEIRQDVADGILRNMSVGFQILSEDAPVVRGEGEVPLVTVSSWRCCEASIVPVPADPTAQTRSQKGRPMAGTKPTTRSRRELTEDEQKRADDAAAAAAGAGTEEGAETDPVKAAQAAVDSAKAALQAAEDALAAAEGEGGESGDDAAAAEEAARAARATAARSADKTAIAGLRTIAVREGREADFDAMAAAGAPLTELRAVALTAMRTSTVEIGTRTGAGERAEKPKLLSFHQVRAAKAAAAANRK